MPVLDTDGIPHADHVVVARCADERCGKLHIIMFDENHVPLAIGAIDSLEEHIENLRNMAYSAAARRPG